MKPCYESYASRRTRSGGPAFRVASNADAGLHSVFLIYVRWRKALVELSPTPITLAVSVIQRRVTLVDVFPLDYLFHVVAQAVDVSAVAPANSLAFVTAVGTVARDGDFSAVFTLVSRCHTSILSVVSTNTNLTTFFSTPTQVPCRTTRHTQGSPRSSRNKRRLSQSPRRIRVRLYPSQCRTFRNALRRLFGLVLVSVLSYFHTIGSKHQYQPRGITFF